MNDSPVESLKNKTLTYMSPLDSCMTRESFHYKYTGRILLNAGHSFIKSGVRKFSLCSSNSLGTARFSGRGGLLQQG